MGEIFKHRLLFSILFSGNFLWGDKVLMEGNKVVIGGSPIPPLGKTLPGYYSLTLSAHNKKRLASIVSFMFLENCFQN